MLDYGVGGLMVGLAGAGGCGCGFGCWDWRIEGLELEDWSWSRWGELDARCLDA